MNRLAKWLMSGIRFLLAEFFTQIVAAAILFAAFVAWAYFSSIYATIPGFDRWNSVMGTRGKDI